MYTGWDTKNVLTVHIFPVILKFFSSHVKISLLVVWILSVQFSSTREGHLSFRKYSPRMFSFFFQVKFLKKFCIFFLTSKPHGVWFRFVYHQPGNSRKIFYDGQYMKHILLVLQKQCYIVGIQGNLYCSFQVYVVFSAPVPNFFNIFAVPYFNSQHFDSKYKS